MKILLVDNGTSLLQKLQKLAGTEVTTKKWDEVVPTDASTYDLIILSGSSHYSVVRNYELFTKEVALIKSAKVPMIGICFGCELLAYTFGGKLGELKERSHGIKEIRFVEEGNSLKVHLNVYESHDWIISELPKEFSVISVKFAYKILHAEKRDEIA